MSRINFDAKDLRTLEYLPEDSQFLKEERAVVHWISKSTLDRGGDVVNPQGMDDTDFVKGRTVLFNHDFDKPCAKNLWLKKETDGVLAKTVFGSTDFANDIYTLNLEGIINSWSIGFIIPDDQNACHYDSASGKFFIEKWNLYEYSNVSVPMNADCINVAKGMVKSLGAKMFLQNEEIKSAASLSVSELRDELNAVKELLTGAHETDVKEIERIIEEKLLLFKEEMTKGISSEIAGSHETKIISLDEVVKSTVSGAVREFMGRIS